MKKGFSVHPVQHPRYKFVVRGKIGSKSQVNYFNSKVEAKTFAEVKNTELVNFGRESLEFPTALRVAALEAHSILAPLGVSILEAAKDFVARETARRKSVEVGVVVEELARVRLAEGNSRDWSTSIRHHGGRFARHFAGRMLSDISVVEVRDYLGGLDAMHPLTYNGQIGVLTTLFSYGKKLGYCSENPAYHQGRKKVPDVAPGIFTVEQAEFILHNAPDDLLPYFAIGFFAGIRSAEICRLQWSEIDLEAGLIEVPATKAKSARRRLVKIEPCLDSWLRPLKHDLGPVAPPCLKPRLKTFRNSFPQLGKWPKNGARHSYCSYHLAHFNDAARLALEMGHTTTQLIFQFYRHLVRPAGAAKFWQLHRPATGDGLAKQVRKPWEVPPYTLRHRDTSYRMCDFVSWTKDGKEHRKYFKGEAEARAWMYEKNAPWFQGQNLPEADERKKPYRRANPSPQLAEHARK